MGACYDEAKGILNVDRILENMTNFFKGLAIRQLGIDKLQDKIKAQLFSGKATNVEEWKKFFGEEIINSEFTNTSKEVVKVAMDDAKTNYNDQTLPLLALFFMADSDKDNFNTAFKAINLAKNTQETVSETRDVVNQAKSGQLFSGGIISGIQTGVKAITNVADVGRQAANPNIIKKEDLKNLTAYYTNFITLLPVNILAKTNEGVKLPEYVNKILNSAFDKNAQINFVEKKIFGKYNEQEEINVDEFFEENYEVLKDDNTVRKEMVENYISELTPSFIKNLVKGSKKKKSKDS